MWKSRAEEVNGGRKGKQRVGTGWDRIAVLGRRVERKGVVREVNW